MKERQSYRECDRHKQTKRERREIILRHGKKARAKNFPNTRFKIEQKLFNLFIFAFFDFLKNEIV